MRWLPPLPCCVARCSRHTIANCSKRARHAHKLVRQAGRQRPLATTPCRTACGMEGRPPVAGPMAPAMDRYETIARLVSNRWACTLLVPLSCGVHPAQHATADHGPAANPRRVLLPYCVARACWSVLSLFRLLVCAIPLPLFLLATGQSQGRPVRLACAQAG